MANFKQAFAAARKAGKGTFSWNGKKYTTELKKESKTVKPKARPKDSLPKPKAQTKAPDQPKKDSRVKANEDAVLKERMSRAEPDFEKSKSPTKKRPKAAPSKTRPKVNPKSRPSVMSKAPAQPKRKK
jgi:hypothetical protein